MTMQDCLTMLIMGEQQLVCGFLQYILGIYVIL